LIYSIFNGGSCLIETESFSEYKELLPNVHIKNLPISLENTVRQMTSVDPNFRPNLKDFMNTEYFNNTLINTIKYLDDFTMKPVLEKARFLKGLPNLLQQISLKTVKGKILSVLVEELKNSLMVPFLLPSIFWICERLSHDEFLKILLAFKETVFKIKDPPQVNIINKSALIMISRIDLFVRKLSDDEFKKYLLTFIVDALENTNLEVQTEVVKSIPKIIVHLDFVTTKTLLLSKLEGLFLISDVPVVKGNQLMALQAMISILDQPTIGERILPLLSKKQNRHSSLVCMYKQVYLEISKKVDTQLIAFHCLPELLKLTCVEGINLTQYNEIHECFAEIEKKVHDDRLKTLPKEELSEIAKLDTIMHQPETTPYRTDNIYQQTSNFSDCTTEKPKDQTAAGFFSRLDNLNLKTMVPTSVNQHQESSYTPFQDGPRKLTKEELAEFGNFK
jgi:SCY1-like protein 2